MEDTLRVLLLGAVQGLTEFLPISSSGHLVVLEHLFPSSEPSHMGTGLEVALHLGTLLAVVVYYRKDLLRILRSLYDRGLSSEERSEGRTLLFGIVAGTAATALVVAPFKGFFESCFERPVLVGAALCVTGLLCLSTRFIPKGDLSIRGMGVARFFVVGLAQGVAVIPGISRSGSTIVTALASGVDPVEAGRYSFLLSIPAVAGAAVLELMEGGWSGEGPSFAVLSAGIAVSALVGFACLGLLGRILRKGGFYRFGYYCLALGVLVVLGFKGNLF